MSVLDTGAMLDGRYRIERVLGQGGMGIVYQAHDVHLERPVAIKLLRAASGSASANERLRKEAAALASMRHEHVVLVHAFGYHDHEPYFVMEFVRGRSLADLAF
jgi:serine/threonine-protein kinase